MIDNTNFFGFTKDQVIDTGNERLALILNWFIALLKSNECQGRDKDQFKDRNHLVLRKYVIKNRFPWLNEREIKYSLDQLEKKGITENKIVTVNYHSEKNRCHAITLAPKFYDKYIMPQVAVQNCQTKLQNCQTVPYINKNKKEDDDKSKPDAKPVEETEKQDAQSKVTHHQLIIKRVLEEFNNLASKTKRKKISLISAQERDYILKASEALLFSESEWSNYFSTVSSIDFLNTHTGEDSAGKWTASFNWLIQKDNIEKIMKGEYASKPIIKPTEREFTILPNGKFKIEF